jgi:osmotically-inducible protein OsmY
MFDHRHVPADIDERYRNNADEDRRGYRDIGQRMEFESAPEPERDRGSPKSYTQTDERIREDVCDRLSHDWGLDASEIEVMVSNGEVTLTGTISDFSQKFRAERIADSVSGVNDVHNELRVQREQPMH